MELSGNKIITYDCTLRDGGQAEGITLSLEDKLRIARRLDQFGIDIIEGGYPASNPKDIEFFKTLKNNPLSHAKLAAFGSTCKKETEAAKDQGLLDLLESEAPVVTLVGKTWDCQVTQALQTTLEENLRMIYDSVSFMASQGRIVVFDAEHFFDGFKANAAYAMDCLKAAAAAGATSLDLCDTNGGTLPMEVAFIVDCVATYFANSAALSFNRETADDPASYRPEPLRLGVHCHNDSGCAVANSLTAAALGVSQIQGTVNGYGERVGNADLLTIIANLQLKMHRHCVSDESLQNLTSVANFVAEVCNKALAPASPYVGSSAFAHKGGLHGSALARMSNAYEHVSPSAVGNSTRMIVSELAGKATLKAKLEAMGIKLDTEAEDQDVDMQKLLDEIKERESAGYSYELADGSLAILVERALGTFKPHFQLESFRVIVDDREYTDVLAKDAQSEATIKIRVGEERFVATGEGVGPVGAIAKALNLALSNVYPQIELMKLVDFKVRLLDESTGTDAITRVSITTQDKDGCWGTIGVSENIIEASWNALVEAVEYGLMRAGV